ncbi:MAG: radical SAM protein [Parcubacteria group bacterium]
MTVRNERLHILTNSHCNNGCLFCSDVHKQNRLDYRSLRKYAEKDLRAMQGKVNKVLFSSGEPTLHPDLIELVEIAKKCGYPEIGLISNGRRFADKKFCEKIVKAGVTEINVSLHGSVKEIHEKITRVPGSFSETFLGICNLSFLREKYPFQLYINFLMNKINYKNIKDFLELIISFPNIEGIVLNTVLPEGRAEENFEEIVPDYSKVGKNLRKAVAQIERKSKKHPKIYIMGLPPCLIRGLETNVINYEPAMRRKNLEARKTKPASVRWPEKIKGANCRKCKMNEECSGVWKSYIKRKGWKEFNPVIFQKKR